MATLDSNRYITHTELPSPFYTSQLSKYLSLSGHPSNYVVSLGILRLSQFDSLSLRL
jgi:hypothetical protein